MEEKRLPNWQDPFCAGFSARSGFYLSPSAAGARSQRVRRRLGEAWTGPFPQQDRKAVAICPPVDVLYLPNFPSAPEACVTPDRGVQAFIWALFPPGDTRELERLSHGGLIPPPPALGASSGCCR